MNNTFAIAGHQASLTLDNDQIIFMATGQSIEIIPTPGPGKLLIPTFATALLDNSAGAYNADGVTDIPLRIIAENSSVVIWCNLTSFYTILANPDVYFAVIPSTIDLLTAFVTYLNQYENIGLAVSLFVATDLTGGNAANTLKIFVSYAIFNILTGQFE